MNCFPFSQAQLLKELDRPLKQAARAVVPAYLTTQVAALHRESGVLPARLEVARRQERWQLRLAAAPEHSPCHAFGRLEQKKARKGAAPKGTNLQKLWGEALKIQRPALPPPGPPHPRRALVAG